MLRALPVAGGLASGLVPGSSRGPAVRPEPGGPILVAVDNTPIRRVGSHLVIDVHQPAELILQVAVSGLPGATVREDLAVSRDGQPLVPPETTIPGEGRVHVLPAGPGRMMVSYQATVEGQAGPPEVTEADRLTYLRPSRYAESDRLAAIARAEFGGISLADDLLAAVSSWVGTQLSYVPGSSGPTDGAVQTLLSRQGVCRDLRSPGHRAAAGAGRARPAGRRVRARAGPDGLPRGGRSPGRRGLAGG